MSGATNWTRSLRCERGSTQSSFAARRSLRRQRQQAASTDGLWGVASALQCRGARPPYSPRLEHQARIDRRDGKVIDRLRRAWKDPLAALRLVERLNPRVQANRWRRTPRPRNSNRSHALSNRSGVGQAAKTWKLQSAWPRPGLEMRRMPPFVGVFRAQQTPGDPLTAATRPILVA